MAVSVGEAGGMRADRRTASLVPMAAEPVSVGAQNMYKRWRFALLWTICATVFFISWGPVAGWLGVRSDPAAVAKLYAEVPVLVYYLSSSAFFAAAVINVVSLLFESTYTKQELALMQLCIKMCALYGDIMAASGHEIVVMDSIGQPLLLHRYALWTIGTPTMVYVIARMSDFKQRRVIAVLLVDISWVATGFLATLWGGPAKWACLAYSCAAFVWVVYQMSLMVTSAKNWSGRNPDTVRGLNFILYSNIFVWMLFPIAWFGLHFGWISLYAHEVMTIAANLLAKATIYSSSVMYANFVTIVERQTALKEQEEVNSRQLMVEQLKHAVKMKEDFMALIGHELSAPLATILKHTKEFFDTTICPLTGKPREWMEGILKSANHLSSILSDIADASSIQKGKLTIKYEDVHMKSVVDDIMMTATGLAKEGVQVSEQVEEGLPMIRADKARIKQMIFNLLGNALKFTMKGHVRIIARLSGNRKEIVIQVQDTGPGIPADKLTTIWQAFGQGDMSTTRKHGGTGLGLHIVKVLAELHGGNVGVETQIDHGSMFTIRIPLRPPSTLRGTSNDHKRMSHDVRASHEASGGGSGHGYGPTSRRSSRGRNELAHGGGGSGSSLRSGAPSQANSLIDQGAAERAVAAVPSPTRGGNNRFDLHVGAGVSPPGIRRTGEGKPDEGKEAGVAKLLRQPSRRAKVSVAEPLPQSSAAAAALNEGDAPAGDEKRAPPRRRSTRNATQLGREGNSPSAADAERETHHQVHESEWLVLYVDDHSDGTVEKCFGRAELRGARYKVHRVDTADEALAFLDEQETLPDIIICELKLKTGRTGADFCKHLRTELKIAQSVVPLIMVAADPIPPERRKKSKDGKTPPLSEEEKSQAQALSVEALNSGCSDFMFKPLKQEAELLARAEVHLKIKQDTEQMTRALLQTNDDLTLQILSNILPDNIIERWFNGQKIIGDSYPDVCVMFSDIVNFADISASLGAEQVFALLAELFSTFDGLTDQFGMYKVETVGDGYMVVAGHDEKPENAAKGHPLARTYQMAEAMLAASAKFSWPDGIPIKVRLGMHHGSVFAGVIGTKCPRYCFLGDTVNTASRMETAGFPGCLHVSDAVVAAWSAAGLDAIAGADERFSNLGTRPIKGKGQMTTYLAKLGNWEEAAADVAANPELLTRQPSRVSAFLAADSCDLDANPTVIARAAAAAQAEMEAEKLEGEYQTALAAASAGDARVRELQEELAAARTALEHEQRLVDKVKAEIAAANATALDSDDEAEAAECDAASVPQSAFAAASAALDGGDALALGRYSVVQLLEECGLEAYAVNMDRQGVGLAILLQLDHAALEALGVFSFGHRITIMDAIRQYARACLRLLETH